MKEKIKVCFILPTLSAGGAEKVISFVSQNLDKNKFDVTLLVIGFKKDSKFEVTEIPVIYLNKNRVLNAVHTIIKSLRKQRPKIVLSTITHLNIMMGLISIFFPKIKFIGRHATISQIAKNYKTGKKKLVSGKIINSFGMKNLDYIICQSNDMKKDFLEVYNIEENRVKIIHNPVTNVSFVKTSIKKNQIKKFITIGRLSKIKGQLRLLDILSKLRIPFKFTIIGEGSYEARIFKRIKILGLIDKVSHISYTENVFQYLSENDMFLQGSYSEGFPNALLESCAVGTPVIAFNVPGGTKDIVLDGVNGFLVNDENEFLKKLKDNRVWDPEAVRESVMKKFNEKKILKQYENLFLDVLK